MNGTGHSDDEEARAGFSVSPNVSDTEADEGDDAGDYSTRFEELISDAEEDGHGGHEEHDGEDDDDDDGFFYSGKDSNTSGDYRQQLKDVLGSDHEDDELEEQQVEHSLLHEVEEKEKLATMMEDEAKVCSTVVFTVICC